MSELINGNGLTSRKWIFGLNTEKLKKLICYTSFVLGINHLFISIWVSIYNIGVPSARGLDLWLLGALAMEVALLFIYVVQNDSDIGIRGIIKSYFTKDQVLISLIPCLVVISLTINYFLDGYLKYDVNFKYLLDISINVFVIYPLGRFCVKNRIPKAFEIVLHIIIIGITVYIAYILFNVFNDKVITTFFRGKIGMMKLEIGIDYYEYHLQINSHHNTTGAFAGAFTIISVCMAMWKKSWLRIVYIIAIVIHGVTLILANSRSTFLAASIFGSLIMGITVFYYAKNKWRSKRVIKWILFTIAVILVFLLLINIRKNVFTLYERCTNTLHNDNYGEGTNIEEKEEQIENVENLARNLDVSNLMGREIIWTCAVQGMFLNARNMLIGVTPEGVWQLIGELSNGMYYVYSHNELLEIGVGLGFPAMLILILWLAYLANRCLVIGLSDDKKNGINQKVIPLFVLFLVLFNMVEAILFFYNTLIGGLFMLTSSWCFEKVRCDKN